MTHDVGDLKINVSDKSYSRDNRLNKQWKGLWWQRKVMVYFNTACENTGITLGTKRPCEAENEVLWTSYLGCIFTHLYRNRNIFYSLRINFLSKHIGRSKYLRANNLGFLSFGIVMLCQIFWNQCFGEGKGGNRAKFRSTFYFVIRDLRPLNSIYVLQTLNYLAVLFHRIPKCIVLWYGSLALKTK